MIPAWLLMSQSGVTDDTLKKQALPPGTLQTRRWLDANPGAGGASMMYAQGGPAPAAAPQAGAPAVRLLAQDAVKNAYEALGLTPEEQEKAKKALLDPEGTKIYGEGTKENERATTTKQLTSPEIANEQRNRAIDPDRQPPALKAERKRLNDIGGVLEGLAGEAVGQYKGFNFQPLLNLAKAEYGRDLGEGYVQPHKEATELGKLGVSLANVLTDGTHGLTQDELKFMTDQLQDKTVYTEGTKDKGGSQFLTGTAAGGDPLSKILLGLSVAGMKGGTGATGGMTPYQMYQVGRGEKKDAEAVENKLDDRITKFVDKRNKFFPALLSSLGNLDTLITKNKGKVPGFVHDDTPLLGDTPLKGYELPFNVLKDEDGKTVAREAETIKAAVINEYSGAASAEKEARRIASSLGQSLSQGEGQFKQALRDLAAALKRAESDREKALGSTAQGELKKRGITTSDDIDFSFGAEAIKSPAAGEADAEPWTGVPDDKLTPAQAKDILDWQERHKK